MCRSWSGGSGRILRSPNKWAPRDQAGARREARGSKEFALRARGEGDRFQSLLRPDPAPLFFWAPRDQAGARREALRVGLPRGARGFCPLHAELASPEQFGSKPSALSGGVGCVNKNNASRPPQEADPTAWLEMDATAGPSSILFGFTDQRLTGHGGLIVGPRFLRRVGFRSVPEGAPPSPSDQPHRLLSQRRRLGFSGRCPLRHQHAFQGGLRTPSPSYNPAYHPRTS